MPLYELPGDPDSIPKNNTPAGPGTPSTPPGPGGGFGGGFGSFFGNGFGAYGGGDQLNGMPRKLGMGAMVGGRMNGPMTHGVASMVNNGGPQSMVAGALHAAYGGGISGPGTGTSDSIPAKLSNGEFVVRAEVAQQPGVKEFLHLLNAGHFHDDVPGMQDASHVQDHIQHFAGGGAVHPSGYGVVGGGRAYMGPSELQNLLGGLTLQELEQHNKWVKGASGTGLRPDEYGAVRDNEGKGLMIPGAMPTFPIDAQSPGVAGLMHILMSRSQPVQHFANGGWVGSVLGHAPGHNPNGSPIGANAPTGGFQQSNPWGVYANDQRGDMNGAYNRMFGAAGQAGVFDPNGSSALTNQLRQHAMMDAGAQESGLVNQARMQFGDDPQMAGYAALQGRMAGQHNTAQALADASTKSAFQNQGFLQNLAAGTMGNSQQAQQQQWMNNHQQSQSPSLGSTLGGIAGTLGGSAISGWLGGRH